MKNLVCSKKFLIGTAIAVAIAGLGIGQDVFTNAGEARAQGMRRGTSWSPNSKSIRNGPSPSPTTG